RDAVRVAEIGERGTPGMHFDRAVLNQRHDRRLAVDVNIVTLARALPLDGLYLAGAGTHCQVALVEAFAADAVGTAHERQWPAVQLVQQLVGHGFDIARELELGDSLRRPDDTVRMRNLRAEDDVVVDRLLFLDGLRRL